MSNQTPDKTARYILNTYARAPFVLARGEGMILYDEDGKAISISPPASASTL